MFLRTVPYGRGNPLIRRKAGQLSFIYLDLDAGFCGPREQGVLRGVHVFRKGRCERFRRRHGARVGPTDGRVQAHLRGTRLPRGRGYLSGEVNRDGPRLSRFSDLKYIQDAIRFFADADAT